MLTITIGDQDQPQDTTLLLKDGKFIKIPVIKVLFSFDPRFILIDKSLSWHSNDKWESEDQSQKEPDSKQSQTLYQDCRTD